jgi:hypothetical protein
MGQNATHVAKCHTVDMEVPPHMSSNRVILLPILNVVLYHRDIPMSKLLFI